MIGLRKAFHKDSTQLALLILESAPVLLPYLFGGKQATLDFLHAASLYDDGQYSANNHLVAVGQLQFLNEVQIKDDHAIACMTLWNNKQPLSFQKQTIQSLLDLLSEPQLKHLSDSNAELEKVLIPPMQDELCVGHLAVSKPYRGLGIGKKLIAKAIQNARQQAFSKLVLDVDADNHQALSFYRACDFVEKYERKFMPTKQTFIRFEYRL